MQSMTRVTTEIFARYGRLRYRSGTLELTSLRKRQQNNGVRAIGFLELPAELREQIYELIVVEPSGKDLYVGARHWYVWLDHSIVGQIDTAKQPPITRVCRQLRREALPLFYAHDTFTTMLEIDEPWAINTKSTNSWLEAIGPHNARAMKSFTIRCSWWRTRERMSEARLHRILSENGLSMVAGIARFEHP